MTTPIPVVRRTMKLAHVVFPIGVHQVFLTRMDLSVHPHLHPGAEHLLKPHCNDCKQDKVTMGNNGWGHCDNGECLAKLIDIN